MTSYPRPLLKPDPQSNSTLLVRSVRSDPPSKVIMVKDKNEEISYVPTEHNYIQNQETLKQKKAFRLNKKEKRQTKSKLEQSTLLKIMNNSYYYIGIERKSYFIIKLLEKIMNIPSKHILLCLKKIKLNSSFRELGDEFSLPPMEALKIFYKNIPMLAKIMRKFIVKFEYLRNIGCVIDCLEIQIQKPSNAIIQRQTWSEHRNANTVKYLVSCNPNGLVNYVSTGYGGRIPDNKLIVSCRSNKHLQPHMPIMANKESKNFEECFQKHGVKLLRRSRIEEANGSQNGNGSRIEQNPGIEAYLTTVMGFLQGFAMLGRKACVNRKSVKVLDDVVIIACGLINLLDNTQPTRRRVDHKKMQ